MIHCRVPCVGAALALLLTPFAIFAEAAAEKPVVSEAASAPVETKEGAEKAAAETKKAPPVQAVQKTQEDDVEELDVFKVTTSGDQGYIATHTLAGSRLNSELRETPAIIDVYTNQFMVDTGATTIDDVLLFSNNSLIDDGGNDGAVNATGPRSAGSSDRSLTRGITGSRTRDYFDTKILANIYNVERLDDARGPNSILFGIGSAGGTLNATTKRARLDDSFGQLHLQYISHDSFYSAFDVNQPLKKGKAGVRLNAVRDDRNTWRQHNGNTGQAINPVFTLRPFKNTEIRVSYERGYFEGSGARNYTANDGITRWLDNGSQIQSVANGVNTSNNGTENTALGIERVFTSTRLVWIEDQDLVVNSLNYRRSASYGTLDKDHPAMVDIPALYPYESNPSGPGSRILRDFSNKMLVLEQRLTRDLSLEVGYYSEKFDSTTYDTDGAPRVVGDPNIFLRNPTQIASLGTFVPTVHASGNLNNPNAGRQYFEDYWKRNIADIETTTYRGTIAWQKNAGDLGEHQVALYVARQEDDSRPKTESEVWVGQGAAFNADPVNDNNGVIRRRYFTPGVAETQYMPDPLLRPSLAFNYSHNSTATFALQNRWVQSSDDSWNTRKIDSAMIALQSRWWKRNLTTTVGYRTDTLNQTRVDPVRDTTGIWTGTNGVWAFNDTAFAGAKKFKFTGETFTSGATLKLRSNLSVFANAARNIGLPEFSNKIGPDGVSPPPPEGEGSDVGFLVTLLKDKLVARVNYFVTDQIGVSDAMGVGGMSATINEIIATLAPYDVGRTILAQYSDLPNPSNSARPVATANADLRDNNNSGYEARVTANLSKGWRFSMNYSYSTQTRENAYQFTDVAIDQIGQYIAAVQAANPSTNISTLATGNNTNSPNFATVGAAYSTTVVQIENRRVDFQTEFGNRKHKANAVVNYTVPEGRLKGFTLGLMARYQSAPIIGRELTRPGDPIRGPGAPGLTPLTGSQLPVYGTATLEYDAFVRYIFKRGSGKDRKPVSIQLNVKNLFPKEGLYITRYKSDGISPDRFAFYSPQEILLSTRIDF